MPEMHFKGKEFVYNHHLTVPYRPLVPNSGKSVGGTEMNGNLIIHGDNLHALKALLPLYARKVDCIFIDPPYNTGNENWNYNDNVNSPMMREWLSSNPVNKEDMLRHDKWLCMMYPRLVLMRELLSESGSLWMTLDDNEIHRARSIMDEIFGEENFVACISWEKRYTRSNNANMFYSLKDYVLVYRKSELLSSIKELRTGKADSMYSNPDGDSRGAWSTSSYVNPAIREERPNLCYAIENPFTGEKVEHPTHAWKYSKEENARHILEKRLWWGLNGDAKYPRLKLFLAEAEQLVPVDVWDYETTGTTDEGGEEVKRIFGSAIFDNPKPTRLIERILKMLPKSDATILDSFAGSGTTAHAVLDMNKKDGGDRRFILIEFEDYADTITAERVRQVINGYEFVGTQREELYHENISLTTLKRPDKLLDQIASIEHLDGHRFDNIRKEIKNGILTVTGERQVAERAEGLGGRFTFCTLGEPVDLDKMLTGENLPSYKAIGSWLFHTATGEALDPARVDESQWFLGESSGFYVWLVYQPKLDFLKSREAALTLNLAEKIAEARKGKRHLVFAPAKFVPNKTLLPLGVEYAPLPFALYRVGKG
jgi:adenine-specific DNA-methyltransferase